MVYLREQALQKGGTRDVRICNDCAVVYPSPRLDIEESLKYLNESGQDNDESLKDPTLAMGRHKVTRWLLPRGSFINMGYLIKKLAGSHKGNALDIGAFTGQFCHVLNYIGFHAYGLEPSLKAVNFARSKGVDVYRGSFPDDIPQELSEVKFDVISLLEAICYVIDLKKGLGKVRDMLTDDGLLVVKCHQCKSPYYSNGKVSIFKRYGDGVQSMPTLDSLRKCLEKEGFSVLYVSGSVSETVAPFKFSSKIANVQLRKVFYGLEMLLNKLHETALLDPEKTDQVIVVAKKKE